MKIVIYSPNFHPLVGGLENMVRDMATEFSRVGHFITVITATAGAAPDNFPFVVVRRPGFVRQVRIMRQADVVLQFNTSLKGVLPWLLSGKPLAISHQTANTRDWRGRLKTWVANRLAGVNIGCSRYMSAQFEHAETVPNAFDNTLFRIKTPWEERRKELVFAGRLVSDKGVDLLLRALASLRLNGFFPKLTIVGAGSEENTLQQLVGKLGLQEQVEFAGLQKGEALVDLLNAHHIMVVPSIWEEPFGIVALEGLACGCVVIGSDGGGLPEAIGGLGPTFPNKDLPALVQAVEKTLTDLDRFRPDPVALESHLKKHNRPVVARAYLNALEKLN